MLRNQTCGPVEIWVWCDGTKADDCLKRSVDVHLETNVASGVYGRFALAILARTPFVLVLDDDMLPGPRFLESCKNTCIDSGSIVAAAGVIFNSCEYLDSDRFGWPKLTPDPVIVDVGCNGWLARTEWVQHLWREPPQDWTNGEDMQLAFLAQKYAGIRTVTAPQPTLEYVATTESLGRDLVAVSASLDHYSKRTVQLRRQLAQGWRTVRNVGWDGDR